MSYGQPPDWTPNAFAAGRPALYDAALTRHVLRRRLAAFVLDGLFLAALCSVLWLVLLTFGLLTLGLGLPLLALLPAVPVLYNWLTVGSAAAATPGQAIMGLTVRRDADLAAPSSLEALVWTLGFVATVSLGAIWFGFALLTSRRRTLHDLLSGLTVVRRRALQEALTGPGIVWNAPDGGPRYV